MMTIKVFEVNYFSENTYILHDDTGEAVIIDCGCSRPEEEERVSDYITQQHLTLKHNLCTHFHLDHIFGNAFLYRKYGLHPEAHRMEIEKLPSPQEQARLFKLPAGKVGNVTVEKYITGGESITFGSSELTAILVPGHSPGSLAFYDKKNGCLFSGDTLFAGSIGRSDLWGGNEDILVAAIRNKLFSLPDETVVYPGHGQETTIFAEKMSNPFL
jgi:glyoxylase-like metal-dependent hydrolase (beta-lactamase superfamily II)